MRLKTGLAIVALASTMLWGATAFAQDGGAGWQGGRAHGGVLRSLGLTDAQKQQVHQIFVTHRPQLRALRTQLRVATHDMKAKLYSSTPPTTADLAPINQLRGQLAQERLQLALEIRGVLTPDQLTQATQKMQQMDQLHNQMRSLMTPAS